MGMEGDVIKLGTRDITSGVEFFSSFIFLWVILLEWCTTDDGPPF